MYMKLAQILSQRGCTLAKKRGHLTITRNIDKHVVFDLDIHGMTKDVVRNNIELLLLATTMHDRNPLRPVYTESGKVYYQH